MLTSPYNEFSIRFHMELIYFQSFYWHHCWKKGGFKIKDDDVVGDYNAADENDLADVPLPPNMESVPFEAIVNVDKDIPKLV